jgi:hypothetical protein
MKPASFWKQEFQRRVERAVGSGVGFDMLTLVQELIEDAQEDMRWWKLRKRKRVRYGILSEAEVRAMKLGTAIETLGVVAEEPSNRGDVQKTIDELRAETKGPSVH